MEGFSQAHRKLQIFCADFWDTAEACQVVLSDVGIDTLRISLAEPSIMRWYRIILELIRRNDGSMAKLVVVLMNDYPNNKELRDACAPWIPAEPARTSTHATEPEPAAVPKGAVLVKKFEKEPAHDFVPVVAPVDFADDASLVVPKIDTLWDAVVGMEARCVAIENRLNALESPRLPLLPRRKS